MKRLERRRDGCQEREREREREAEDWRVGCGGERERDSGQRRLNDILPEKVGSIQPFSF